MFATELHFYLTNELLADEKFCTQRHRVHTTVCESEKRNLNNTVVYIYFRLLPEFHY